MTNPILHIIDDDDFLRTTLVEWFEEKSVECIEYSSAENFLINLPSHQCGCILLDITMKEMSGLELFNKILSDKVPVPPIIFLTGTGRIQSAVKTMKQGAFDFLEKPIDNEILTTSVFRAINSSIDSNILLNKFSKLSKREREIGALLATGILPKIIACDLNITEATIYFHKQNIMKKLEFSTREKFFEFFSDIKAYNL